MADNTRIDNGTTGDNIATDDVGGVTHQRMKVEFGDDGSATDVSATNLRWSFDPVKGFPWNGYYLFRRPSRRGDEDRICVSRYLTQYRAGEIGAMQVQLGPGVLSSNQQQVFIDDFAPGGAPEVDLDDRASMLYTLPAADIAQCVEATIGFRKTRGHGERVCVDFDREQPGTVPNPFERDGATFCVHQLRRLEATRRPPDGPWWSGRLERRLPWADRSAMRSEHGAGCDRAQRAWRATILTTTPRPILLSRRKLSAHSAG